MKAALLCVCWVVCFCAAVSMIAGLGAVLSGIAPGIGAVLLFGGIVLFVVFKP